MAKYINKGNAGFQSALNGEYVDKSRLISVVNRSLFTEWRFSCVTRCRRFGKSLAAKMLCAYYDQSCDSKQMFSGLQIAADPQFEQHLNKYPVIFLDMTDFVSADSTTDIAARIDYVLKKNLTEAYPDVQLHDNDDLMDCLFRIKAQTGQHFIFIIDEWDAVCREHKSGTKAMDSYVTWLRQMFKSSNAVDVFAGVYMTGILPVKKFKTESALNNFYEYSMVLPGKMAPYFGFTNDEVRMLADRHNMDIEELEKWYDGYQIGDEPSIFNPNSVMKALGYGSCRSYWTATASFDTVATYININFDGLKDDIICMLSGGRVKVNPTKFQNDMSIIRSKDDVLTVLIHLGYLSYDWRRSECFVPNMEVSGEMVNAIEQNRWEHTVRSLQQSERLLEATLRGDADTVARMIDNVHTESTSILSYNDENSLACVISLAYYSARNHYHIHREYATGRGYADLVLIPRKNVDTPAMVIELKYDKSASAAIEQIKQKNYPAQVANYSGNILLVGINYDKETKKHDCMIEQTKLE
jgi:hypothetical protein